MKKVKLVASVFFLSLFFLSCEKEEDPIPEPVNEEEVITTMTITLTPNGGGTPINLKSVDLDADGPNPPVITVSKNLEAGVTYTGSIMFLNETKNPAEDITEEVEEESEEHQVIYTVGKNLNVTTTYSNFDKNNNNLGTKFTLKAGTASTGKLTITLLHEPTKPNTGLGDAGGETDFETTFDLVIK